MLWRKWSAKALNDPVQTEREPGLMGGAVQLAVPTGSEFEGGALRIGKLSSTCSSRDRCSGTGTTTAVTVAPGAAPRPTSPHRDNLAGLGDLRSF